MIKTKNTAEADSLKQAKPAAGETPLEHALAAVRHMEHEYCLAPLTPSEDMLETVITLHNIHPAQAADIYQCALDSFASEMRGVIPDPLIEGRILAPKMPTLAMLEAASARFSLTPGQIARIYYTMINAAPV